MWKGRRAPRQPCSPRIGWRLAAAGLVLGLPWVLSCSGLGYYSQAVWGQTKILAARRNVLKLVAAPATPEDLSAQLRTVLSIRAFATAELHLPDNGSYRGYVELGEGRRHVVWNVVAAPELSTEPVVWCFPVAGCVSYRGYFSERRAHRFAERLRENGYDVDVGGAAAYSTLGFFRDPVLSTVIDYPEIDLAGLLFHELAHQLLYVRDDTPFNESFATAVEIAGVRRYLAATGGGEATLNAYLERQRREDEFTDLVLGFRGRLAEVYLDEEIDDDGKRRRKAATFAELKRAYEELAASWEGDEPGYDAWFARPLNNARLASIGAYHGFVPAFLALLDASDGDLEAFYEAVGELADLAVEEREALLRRHSSQR